MFGHKRRKKRKKLLTGELPTTFLYFSGHTCDVDISVHENGWEPNANADKDFTVYFNEVYGDRYEEVKEYLLELKKKTVELALETVKQHDIDYMSMSVLYQRKEVLSNDIFK